jgi:hypothetical protein
MVTEALDISDYGTSCQIMHTETIAFHSSNASSKPSVVRFLVDTKY